MLNGNLYVENENFLSVLKKSVLCICLSTHFVVKSLHFVKTHVSSKLLNSEAVHLHMYLTRCRNVNSKF